MPVQLFANVRLGPLLGKGGYAKVLRGTWNEKTVAVKVCRWPGAASALHVQGVMFRTCVLGTVHPPLRQRAHSKAPADCRRGRRATGVSFQAWQEALLCTTVLQGALGTHSTAWRSSGLPACCSVMPWPADLWLEAAPRWAACFTAQQAMSAAATASATAA